MSYMQGQAQKLIFQLRTYYNQTLEIHQFSSVAQSCPTLCDPMDHSMPSFPVFHYFPESVQTHVHWINDAIQPSYPLSPCSPAGNLSQHQSLFQWVDSSDQVAKVLALQLQHQSSNEYSRLISFIIDEFDYLAVQVTLKSLPQHHSLKTSVLQCSAFFMV